MRVEKRSTHLRPQNEAATDCKWYWPYEGGLFVCLLCFVCLFCFVCFSYTNHCATYMW